MRTYTFPRVFPHVEIHTIRCKSSYGFYTFPAVFRHTHSMWNTTSFSEKRSKSRSQRSVQKYQYFEWGSALNLDGFKITKWLRRRIRFRVYFPMRTYTFPRVFPHVEIHTIRCKSSYGFYTLPLAFPHAAIHYFRCISTSLKIHLFWRNSTCGVSPILVYFRFSGNSLFLAWFRMRLYTSHSVFPPVGNSLFRA